VRESVRRGERLPAVPLESRVVRTDDVVTGGTKDYASYSLWLETCGDDLTPRDPLGAEEERDVVIVGAGYTGLWTAYYLAKADPGLRIAVLEADIAGFGASGRNGGWCSALLATDRARFARTHGRAAAIALQRAMFDTVDEVGRSAAAEGIDAHFIKGGTLRLATQPAHVATVREEVERERSWGFGEEHYRWLDARQARARLDAEGVLGAAYTPHCAAIHPARLVRGLARAVERLGVTIYERSPALSLGPGDVRTPHGRVRADVIVRATEGYTVELPRLRRAVLPIYSLMIATEPLPAAFWDEVGWSARETVTDGRHMLIYAQRTVDDRIAIGGRGAPYHFGSRVEDRFDRDGRVFAAIEGALRSLFPGLGPARITHSWGGPLAAPRDFKTSVGFDPSSGMAWAGGYVGDGVSTANLAGRTLTDLVLRRDSELVRLPWVNHRSRKWEPEPLRWVGARAALWGAASADRVERRTGRPARRAVVVGKLVGRNV
jgi:glycine/D-amino acid oxidase-like deaminating enzyme